MHSECLGMMCEGPSTVPSMQQASASKLVLFAVTVSSDPHLPIDMLMKELSPEL